MPDLQKRLAINPAKEEKRIAELIKNSLAQMDRDGVVIGLSGGLDSSVAAYLLARCLPKRKILALILPERDSSPINMNHARLVAKNLGLNTIEINMTPVLEKMGVYKIGPEELKDKTSLKKLEKLMSLSKKILGQYNIADAMTTIHGGKPSRLFAIMQKVMRGRIYKSAAFGFTKVRMRMVYLSFYALQLKYAVVGTTNKTEYATGTYDPHGDGAGSIALIKHLYRTQIKQLGSYLGVPNEILNKPSSGDIYGNVSKEESYGMSYEQLDALLLGIEKGLSKQLEKIYPKKAIEECKRAIAISNFGKKLPFCLK